MILDILKKFNTHPTVEEVYAEVHKIHPTIGKTTVYRNLHYLAENNKIREVMLPNDLARYDKRIEQHYHFKCKTCGDIFDIDIEYLEKINETVQEKYGLQIEEHDIIFKGICPKCKNNKN